MLTPKAKKNSYPFDLHSTMKILTKSSIYIIHIKLSNLENFRALKYSNLGKTFYAPKTLGPKTLGLQSYQSLYSFQSNQRADKASNARKVENIW